MSARRPRPGLGVQVLPILLVGMVLVVLVGLLLYLVGAAARLEAEGQTVADAAALAAEQNVKQQLQRVPGDDNVHFSPAGGLECGGARGPVGAGQAFGGNPLSFVSYDVRLVPYGGAGTGGL